MVRESEKERRRANRARAPIGPPKKASPVAMLMRRSTPDLTMRVYARTRMDKLHGPAESVGEAVGVWNIC